MSSDLNFDENNELDTSDPAKIYLRLVSLTLEQIRERVGGQLLSLVRVFILEMDGAVALDAQAYISKNSISGTASSLTNASPIHVVQTWERWLPLVRKEFFVDELESELLSLEERHEDRQNHFTMIRIVARDLNRMSEADIKEYFEVRKDPKRESISVTDGLAMDECEKAQDAHHKGDLLGARIYYERVIDVFAKTGNEKMLATTSLELGNVLSEDGQLLDGRRLYEQAAAIFGRLGDTTNLIVALRNLGRSMATTGDLKGAYQVALQSVQLAKRDEPGTELRKSADLLLKIVDDLPDPEAIKCYRQVIQTFDELKLIEDSASAHLLVARKLVEAERFQEGCESAAEGLRLMLKTQASSQKKHWAIVTHSGIWMAAGRTEPEILKSQKELFEIPGEVKRLGDLCLSLTTDVHQGKLSLDEARRLLREEHDSEPFVAPAVAVLHRDLRETLRVVVELPAEALAILEINHQLLMLAADLSGTQEFASAICLSLGIIYDQMGRLRDAAQTFERGAELARLAGNIEFFITMRLNSAKALERAGDGTAAINCIEILRNELREIDTSKQQPGDYARVCLALAQLYFDQSRPDEAEATALEALQTIGDLHETDPKIVLLLQGIEARLQSSLGIIHKASERYVSAESHLQRSLQLCRILNDGAGMANVLACLAGIRLDLDDGDEALRLYNQAYQVIAQVRDPSYTFIYTERARALLLAGQQAEARRMALLALELSPTARQAAKCTIVLLETATSLAEKRDARAQAELILSSNPAPEIQFIVLSGLLSEIDVSAEQRNEWSARLRGLRNSLDGLQGAIFDLYAARSLHGSKAESEAAIEYLEHCLELVDEAAARNQDRDTQRHIFRIGNTAAQRLLQLKPPDNNAGLEIILRAKARATLNEQFTVPRAVEELRIQLSQQPEPVLLVEMYTLPSETLLYFVTAEGLQGVEHIPITAETVEAENQIIGGLGDFRRHEAAWNSKTWRRLSEAFTGSLSRYLRPKQLVCLIPAGFWHFLPLHACILDGRPLIENHPVYYGPSSAVLSRPGDAEHRLQHCLSVGVDFEQEAAWVADWLGAKGALIGPMAHPHAVLGSIRKADVVHFSCHGSYNPWRGDESGVLLAYQSWLTPSLIEGGTTNADLVTLSACETAFDFVTAANDMVGLDQAFLNMGAVSVLGTLWAVDAEATEGFVKAFYENLTGARGSKVKQMSKAHAVQAAVAQIRSARGSEHPFYWAPFKLTGGWL